MKTVKLILLTMAALGALAALSGCTSTSTRAILEVVSVNDGGVYYSDLVSDSGLVKADACPIKLTSIQNSGGAPLAPGTPFSQIFLTGYTVTYDSGIYPPVSGGLSGIVESGQESEFSIALSDLGAKAAVPTNIATSTTARITVYGFNHINGGNNGDQVSAKASIQVQIANFKDSDVPQN